MYCQFLLDMMSITVETPEAAPMDPEAERGAPSMLFTVLGCMTRLLLLGSDASIAIVKDCDEDEGDSKSWERGERRDGKAKRCLPFPYLQPSLEKGASSASNDDATTPALEQTARIHDAIHSP